ncbi:putative translation initiation inhibitor [Corynespora cassiicola Philippines]|uniref:Putative translation initiation inhibitor n=1 Tax=Corynespora cassiicola Philippines TaxID=1448308 RepID=A0A2T2NJW7_CORCC|nr:putative translation initiation inhibitor [Corynespora cassiicola Philippines]
MSHLKYFNYPGFGEHANKETHYCQSVRIDNRVEISGQGGWDRTTHAIHPDLAAEVDQAFSNVQHALEHAGSKGWPQVYSVRVYTCAGTTGSTILDVGAEVVRNLRKWCTEHEPLLTVVHVAGLYDENMRIEMEVAAHLG